MYRYNMILKEILYCNKFVILQNLLSWYFYNNSVTGLM